jgi:hypothetical protein
LFVYKVRSADAITLVSAENKRIQLAKTEGFERAASYYCVKADFIRRKRSVVKEKHKSTPRAGGNARRSRGVDLAKEKVMRREKSRPAGSEYSPPQQGADGIKKDLPKGRSKKIKYRSG